MNVLVTGASRGVGIAICRSLLEQGNKVYAISRSFSSELKTLEKKYHGKLFFKSYDLSDTANIHKVIFKEFIPNTIVVHGFVNNAATAYDDIITNLDLYQLEMMFRVNVYAPMMLTKYAIRNMIFNKTRGSIVHISSVSVHTGYKGLAMYASSKGALEAFSKNTAREWGSKGIRSNVVVPGFMETAMSATLTTEQKEKIYNRTSLKIPTNIDSVAQTVSFMLSEKASSITGQNIHVDNGTI
ncbi:MAG TPA: SDR family oxidoreductase [Bacteroidales bacterium]|nr:SDR family oxidoreductase [Bacteroidales bacterium]HPS17650.1 SDR family oxidoreductase [Bacteroidales bacterium]